MITPAQCRAARGLLDWTQEELAKAAQVSAITIRGFEKEASSPRRATLAALRQALEAAGVEFTFEGGVQPGVRQRKIGSI
ncbi:MULTISPECIES: helix-turn-helix domain-containing protein [Azospirillum]|uniref:Transcriptional regulator n=2 Tax=Azospirillum TaxID=191 RepID=A0A2K1G486_9PROT|nr:MULTISPECIES: helix-turn-helix transcriptional regulator [Azospirillum]NUB09564.1 helix-turn-helix transcriptional regulator [Azospirillum baldaniorum]PNQ99499.1 transcriptional regulator [Azospirillum argentinense]